MYAQHCEKVLTYLQMDCWNEAAGAVDCDPNSDDVCLCGVFFDEVASCTEATCNIGENLGEYLLVLDAPRAVANASTRSYVRLHGASL